MILEQKVQDSSPVNFSWSTEFETLSKICYHLWYHIVVIIEFIKNFFLSTYQLLYFAWEPDSQNSWMDPPRIPSSLYRPLLLLCLPESKQSSLPVCSAKINKLGKSILSIFSKKKNAQDSEQGRKSYTFGSIIFVRKFASQPGSNPQPPGSVYWTLRLDHRMSGVPQIFSFILDRYS